MAHRIFSKGRKLVQEALGILYKVPYKGDLGFGLPVLPITPVLKAF